MYFIDVEMVFEKSAVANSEFERPYWRISFFITIFTYSYLKKEKER